MSESPVQFELTCSSFFVEKALTTLLTFILICHLFGASSASAQEKNVPTPDSAPPAFSDQADEDDQEEPDFIVPSRPTVSNPAEFQKPGVLQLEYGYDANFHAADLRTEQHAPLALRFAISRRFLLEADNDNVISQTTTDGIRMSGIGDTELGVQGVAVHQTPSHPALAFAYFIKLPTASVAKNLGTGRVDHTFITLLSKKVGQLTIDFNALYVLAGRQNKNGYASSGQGALAVSRNLNKRFGVQGEISGQSRNDEQRGVVFVLAAVTYQLNRRAVFDAGARAGLTPDAPHYGIFAGVTLGLADLYRSKRRSSSTISTLDNPHTQRQERVEYD
jgi:hypothetical protein